MTNNKASSSQAFVLASSGVEREHTGAVSGARRIFLDALRSGEYPKGPFVAGQDEPPPGAIGFCAVGLPYTLFLRNKGPVQGLRKVLGVTKQDLWEIQNEWNDSDLTFPQIADLIEHRIFAKTNGPRSETAQASADDTQPEAKS